MCVSIYVLCAVEATIDSAYKFVLIAATRDPLSLSKQLSMIVHNKQS